MKTFKQYIKEVRMIGDISKEEKFDRLRTISDKDMKKQRWKKMSDIDGKHELYKRGPDKHLYKNEWIVRHKDTGKVHMSVDGTHYKHPKKTGTTGFQADVLASSDDAPMKAHELYKHMITHHNIILQSSDRQSKGGMKVWRRLHKDPDLHVHSFDIYDRANHVDKIGSRTTHTTYKAIDSANRRQLSAGDNWKKASDLFMLKHNQGLKTLVAHKKEDSEP